MRMERGGEKKRAADGGPLSLSLSQDDVRMEVGRELEESSRRQAVHMHMCRLTKGDPKAQSQVCYLPTHYNQGPSSLRLLPCILISSPWGKVPFFIIITRIIINCCI